MSDPMAQSDDHSRLAKAVAKGIGIGLPLGVIGMTLLVWLITDLDLGDAFAAGLLPGVMFGVFAGGFAGMAVSMD
jgi:ABC-type Mn2+/Zn2+ transport system permease subunit